MLNKDIDLSFSKNMQNLVVQCTISREQEIFLYLAAQRHDHCWCRLLLSLYLAQTARHREEMTLYSLYFVSNSFG